MQMNISFHPLLSKWCSSASEQLQHRRKSSKSACGSVTTEQPGQTKPEWILIRGFLPREKLDILFDRLLFAEVKSTLTFEFQDGGHSKHGLSFLHSFFLLCWLAGEAGIFGPNQQHPQTITYLVVFTPKHLVMLIFTRAAVSLEKGAAPCFCITQKINEASSCRETSRFKVHRCSRKQQFFKKGSFKGDKGIKMWLSKLERFKLYSCLDFFLLIFKQNFGNYNTD